MPNHDGYAALGRPAITTLPAALQNGRGFPPVGMRTTQGP